MTQVSYSQMILDPRVRQQACAYLHKLGRGMLVDMVDLEELLARTHTLADIIEIAGLFQNSAPLMQHAMRVKTPDDQVALVRYLNLMCKYVNEEVGTNVVVSKLIFEFRLIHPILRDNQVSIASAVVDRQGVELRGLAGIITPINDAENVINDSLLEEKSRKQLGSAYMFIGETLYRMAEALELPGGSIADVMRSQLMEKTAFVDVLNLMLNPNLLAPLERMFKVADHTLGVEEAASNLSNDYAALRKRLGRVICGYDIVALFNGRRRKLTLPRLMTRNQAELDICALHVSLAESQWGPVDTVHLQADSRGMVVLNHGLVQLRSSVAGDTIPSELRPDGEKQMALLEQGYPEVLLLEQRQRLILALKGFRRYCKLKPEAESVRRDVLRRLLNPANVVSP